MHFNIIEHVMSKTGLKQKDIAERLNVSRAQVSKWKAGEPIPFDRKRELEDMAGLFGDYPEWAAFVENEENAQVWAKYFATLSGYVEIELCADLVDERDLYAPMLVLLLNELGANVPLSPPIINPDSEGELDTFSSVIVEMMTGYSAISNWIDTFFSEYSERDDLVELYADISGASFGLTIKFIPTELLDLNGVDKKLFTRHVKETDEGVCHVINDIYRIMHINGLPIMHNYFDLIEKEPLELDDAILFFEEYSKKTLAPFHLTYAERVVLEKLEEQNDLIRQLVARIEKLESGLKMV